jgi:hypothetical protein
MPMLLYFAVTGSALVGLLFVAETMLPARGPLSISSEFHRASIAVHAEPAGATRTRPIERDLPGFAPAPDMQSAAIQVAHEDALLPHAAPRRMSNPSQSSRRPSLLQRRVSAWSARAKGGSTEATKSLVGVNGASTTPKSMIPVGIGDPTTVLLGGISPGEPIRGGTTLGGISGETHLSAAITAGTDRPLIQYWPA